MARTKAKTGHNLRLAYCATENGSYTDIGEVYEVGLPEVLAPTTEATAYEADSDFEQKIPTGFKDVSDVPFAFNFEKDVYDDVLALVGEEMYYKIYHGDINGSFKYLGSINSLGGGVMAMKSKVSVPGKITVLNVLAYTAGS